ncbi:hypothetical protein UY3_03345 [Chelonia mydas]|uniref:Uncharacterized protein n=1 Tax=Chelonia mydas TaxID=8469 RepID=M7BQB7_CHEMY|nr:hypothetical protein UY3_03345 [Chelonia mydas]
MGSAGSGSQHNPRPMLLPTAPFGLEQQTAASESCDRLNLRALQLCNSLANQQEQEGSGTPLLSGPMELLMGVYQETIGNGKSAPVP